MLKYLELIGLLNQKKYNFETHKHKSLFSVEDSKKLRGKIKNPLSIHLLNWMNDNKILKKIKEDKN